MSFLGVEFFKSMDTSNYSVMLIQIICYYYSKTRIDDIPISFSLESRMIAAIPVLSEALTDS